jgi:hypothetical protein
VVATPGARPRASRRGAINGPPRWSTRPPLPWRCCGRVPRAARTVLLNHRAMRRRLRKNRPGGPHRRAAGVSADRSRRLQARQRPPRAPRGRRGAAGIRSGPDGSSGPRPVARYGEQFVAIPQRYREAPRPRWRKSLALARCPPSTFPACPPRSSRPVAPDDRRAAPGSLRRSAAARQAQRQGRVFGSLTGPPVGSLPARGSIGRGIAVLIDWGYDGTASGQGRSRWAPPPEAVVREYEIAHPAPCASASMWTGCRSR